MTLNPNKSKNATVCENTLTSTIHSLLSEIDAKDPIFAKLYIIIKKDAIAE